MDMLSGETTIKIVLPPSEKGSTLKGNNLLPRANYFLSEWTPYQKELGLLESKQEVTKVPFLKLAENIRDYLFALKEL